MSTEAGSLSCQGMFTKLVDNSDQADEAYSGETAGKTSVHYRIKEFKSLNRVFYILLIRIEKMYIHRS